MAIFSIAQRTLERGSWHVAQRCAKVGHRHAGRVLVVRFDAQKLGDDERKQIGIGRRATRCAHPLDHALHLEKLCRVEVAQSVA